MDIPYKLMKVVWLDAQSSCEWTPIDSETQKLALCVSVGYLLMVDSDSITLTDRDWETSQTTFISL